MKKFLGFTPEQKFKILSLHGYAGPLQEDDMEKFIQATPAAAQAIGKYTEAAQAKLNPVQMAEGGAIDDMYDKLSKQTKDVIYSGDESLKERRLANTQSQIEIDKLRDAAKFRDTAINDPSSVIQPADVATVAQNPDQTIDPATGQLTTAPQAGVQTVNAQTAATPSQISAATVDPSLVGTQVQQATDDLQAATADPSAKATVRGQLEILMDDFEDGTPPWASGAMRSAMGVMQKRGLGASSIAGAAIVQAAMEAALPIAAQDAKTQAEFEMQNLSNEQQTNVLKTQFRINGILNDVAAENAAKQFNAASENQTSQFMANLEATTSQFNAAQVNAIRQFNAGETNAADQFNSAMQDARDKFNAQNSLVIAQANAQWRQNIALTETQNQHDVNMQTAQATYGLTAAAYDSLWQTERDLMSYAFQSSENLKDRQLKLLFDDKDRKDENMTAIGSLVGKLLFGF